MTVGTVRVEVIFEPFKASIISRKLILKILGRVAGHLRALDFFFLRLHAGVRPISGIMDEKVLRLLNGQQGYVRGNCYGEDGGLPKWALLLRLKQALLAV